MVQIDGQPVRIVCDKHGGRNFYGPLLQQRFAEWLVDASMKGNSGVSVERSVALA